MKTVRFSSYEDIPRLMEIYREAREIMISCGDANQWKPGYPSEDMIRDDIEKGRGFLVEENGAVEGAFAFILGEDPTYKVIEGGNWIDGKSPYATIHRLASTKTSHGIAETCFRWSWQQIRNLRIDTHEDNVIMRHCIEKAGFRYCGIIHLLNGDPRIAFQKIDI